MSYSMLRVTPSIPTTDPFDVRLADLEWSSVDEWKPLLFAQIYHTGVSVELTADDIETFAHVHIANTQNCNAALI